MLCESVYHDWPDLAHPGEALQPSLSGAFEEAGRGVIGLSNAGWMGCYTVRPYCVRRMDRLRLAMVFHGEAIATVVQSEV